MNVFLLMAGLNGEETAFMGVGVTDQVVYARLMEERGYKVSWDCVEGERGY